MNKAKVAIAVSKTVSLVQMLVGIWIMFTVGLCAIALTDKKFMADTGVVFLIFLLILGALGVWLIVLSRKTTKLIKEFKEYVAVVSNDPDGYIPDIAASLGTSEDVVKKNLELMIKKNYFVNAFIDQNSNCIVIANKQNIIDSTAQQPQTNAFAHAVAPAATQAIEMVTIKCKGCGGINTIQKGIISECVYCGSPIFEPNSDVSTVQGGTTASASVGSSPASTKFNAEDKKKEKMPKWVIIIAVIIVMIIMIKALSGDNNDNTESNNETTVTEEAQSIELTKEVNADNAEEVPNTPEENSNEFNETVDDNSLKVEDFTYYGGNYLGSIYYMEITMFTTVESDRYGVVFYFDNEGNENYYYLYSDDDAYNDWGYEYDYLFTFNDKDGVIFYLGMKNTSSGVTMDLMTLRATMDTLTKIWHNDPVEAY